MRQVITSLRQAFKDAVKNWVYIPLIVLIDVVFLFVFGFVYSLYFDKILLHMTNIMQAMPDASSLLQQGTGSLSSVYGINASISSIYKLAVLLAISVFVIWLAFQFFSWLIAHRIAGNKADFISYLKSFSIPSIIWFAVFSVIMYVSVIVTLARSFVQEVPSETFGSLYGALIAVGVLGYLVVVSYSLTGKVRDVLKKTFVLCFTKSEILLSYLLLIVSLVAINLIIAGLWYVNDFLAIVLGLILIFAYLFFARVFMIEAVKPYLHKKR